MDDQNITESITLADALTRERVIEAMQLDGDYRVSTWRIARRMNKPTAAVRRELLRMERDGFVCREPVSAVNNTIWRLLPLPPNA